MKAAGDAALFHGMAERFQADFSTGGARLVKKALASGSDARPSGTNL
jgi:hypothetical protein